MKNTLTAIALLLVSSSVLAETKYPENPVLRPLTLTDGTIAITGGLITGEQDDDNRNEAFIHGAYGITDDLTIGFGGLNYRLLSRPGNKTGVELAVGIGFKDYQEQFNKGDSVAYGIDITGKYVFDDNLAMTYGLDIIKWDEEHRKDRSEYRLSFGVQKRLAEDWTLNANYTYRALQDFEQDDARELGVGLNYAYSKNIDMGLFAKSSNFDANENGYKLDNSFDRLLGIYATYRF